MQQIRVLIADSNEIFREGLVSVLSRGPHLRVVGVCSTGEETVQKAIELQPDIILLDEYISRVDCFEVTRQIRERELGTHIIIFTQSRREERDPFYIFSAEASGYVDRETESGNLVGIINRVLEGDFFVSPLQGRKLVEELTHLRATREEESRFGLSDREKEVLFLVAKSLTNREIASRLFITENTVKAHLTGILRKMNVNNRRQAAYIAREKGVVPEDDH